MGTKFRPVFAWGLLVAAGIGIGLAAAVHRDELAQFGKPQDKAWYTVDDGHTYFAAPLSNPTPFSHEGKTAYRCRVFRCAGRNDAFVAFLERRRSATPASGAPPGPPGLPGGRRPASFPGASDTDVKPPNTGDADWVAALSKEGLALIDVRCGDGRLATPVAP